MPGATEMGFALLLAALRPGCVCDVGSMDGGQSLRFRRMLPGARIIAFEANRANYRRMSDDERIRRAGIEVVHAAVTNRAAPVDFYVVDTPEDKPWARGTSSLRLRRPAYRDGLVESRATVQGVRLDETLADEGGRIAVWIDAEGAGYEVVEGLAGIASRVVAVHIEVEHVIGWEGQRSGDDVLRLLEGYGLRPVLRLPENHHQDNVLLVRARPRLARIAQAIGAAARNRRGGVI